jgi:hypothetical protein
MHATGTINVQRPTATVKTQAGSVYGINSTLELGDPAGIPGMTFKATLTNNTGFAGMPLWVQTGSTNYTYWRRSSINVDTCDIGKKISGEGLDDSFPYILGDEAEDSPSITVPCPDMSLWGKMEAHDSFSMYLMFEPEGEDSIPVSLNKVDWAWNGKIIKPFEAETWANTQIVSEESGATNPNPPGADCTEFPAWFTRIQDTPTSTLIPVP